MARGLKETCLFGCIRRCCRGLEPMPHRAYQKRIPRDDRIPSMSVDRRRRREVMYNAVAQLVLVQYKNMPASDRKRVLLLVIHKAIEQEDEQASIEPWLNTAP